MTDTPRWLTHQTVIQIHEEQLAQHGGTDGIRDSGLLESALARPHSIYAYDPNADIYDLAIAYAHGLAKNHAFIDGNKRTAYVVMRSFLRYNGIKVTAPMSERYDMIYALATDKVSQEEMAAWLRDNTERV